MVAGLTPVAEDGVLGPVGKEEGVFFGTDEELGFTGAGVFLGFGGCIVFLGGTTGLGSIFTGSGSGSGSG